jgi:hypothetical protein
MSGTAQKVKLELRGKEFLSATRLLATGESAVRGDEVLLEPYGVFIGELAK